MFHVKHVTRAIADIIDQSCETYRELVKVPDQWLAGRGGHVIARGWRPHIGNLRIAPREAPP